METPGLLLGRAHRCEPVRLARLFRALLSEAVGLTPEQLELANGDIWTVLPKGLRRPWPDEELEIRFLGSEQERDIGSDPGR
jgi:hypothetical protein